MSEPRRAYNLLRAFVGQEYERLKGMGLLDAQKELDAALKPETQLESQPTAVSGDTQAPPEDQRALARQILGVSADATFDEIHAAYERLRKRSDPSRFPVGTDAQKQASEIHRRVNLAYQKLTEDVSNAEKRFRSLEIEE